MESRARLFGHQIHPMLIVFPLGLLGTSLAFDIIYMAGANSRWAAGSFLMIGAGIIMGLVAAVFGLIDWLAIPTGTRAWVIGLWHGLGNVLVVGLFLVSWFLRRPDPDHPSVTAFVLSCIGIALALLTGWLGGELVERLGIGVAEGAHPDAPSSLSDRAVSDRVHKVSVTTVSGPRSQPPM